MLGQSKFFVIAIDVYDPGLHWTQAPRKTLIKWCDYYAHGWRY